MAKKNQRVDASPQLQPVPNGLGELLTLFHLAVPPFQRHYSWNDDEVNEYLDDLQNAIDEKVADYFFGTIVLCGKGQSVFQVVDGQQRLATALITLAVIRDLLRRAGRNKAAQTVHSRYIEGLDLESGDTTAKLKLNTQDDPFMTKSVLPQDSTLSEQSNTKKTIATSTRRLQSAIHLIVKHLDHPLTDPKKEERRLLGWVGFIEKQARVIRITVPDEIAAFTVFETLNDRGVDLAVADLLKNYLFSRAKTRENEVAGAWNVMTGAIETMGERDGVVQFISHYWSSRHGLTRRRLLLAQAKNTIKKPKDAVEVATELRDHADLYVALANPNHSRWKGTSQDMSESIRVLSNVLRVVQIRPLLLSVVDKFAAGAQVKALRYLTNCAVRIIVAGVRGGTIERMYNLMAHAVHEGTIADPASLRAKMIEYVPADERFREEFAALRINRADVARYYLAAIERASQGSAGSAISDSAAKVNLEHVLPESFDYGKWPAFTASTHKSYWKSIGNMCLMDITMNSGVGSGDFASKKNAYKNVNLKLTSEIANESAWTVAAIETRAAKLADIAVKAWPIDFQVV